MVTDEFSDAKPAALVNDCFIFLLIFIGFIETASKRSIIRSPTKRLGRVGKY